MGTSLWGTISALCCPVPWKIPVRHNAVKTVRHAYAGGQLRVPCLAISRCRLAYPGDQRESIVPSKRFLDVDTAVNSCPSGESGCGKEEQKHGHHLITTSLRSSHDETSSESLTIRLTGVKWQQGTERWHATKVRDMYANSELQAAIQEMQSRVPENHG
jgi:hypothetical protein